MCLSPGKFLEKSWEFVSEKGYEPCLVRYLGLLNVLKGLRSGIPRRFGPKYPKINGVGSRGARFEQTSVFPV